MAAALCRSQWRTVARFSQQGQTFLQRHAGGPAHEPDPARGLYRGSPFPPPPASRRMQCGAKLFDALTPSRSLKQSCRGFGKGSKVAGRVCSGVGRITEMDVTSAAPISASGSDEALILAASEDRYDGMIIQADLLPESVTEFQSRLATSVRHWKVQGKKGIWLKLPLSHADLVPTAIRAGFGYHHADPGYCMLTLWLPDVPSTLPANASHQVGVGAFLLNDAGEVLAVQEKNGPLRGTGIWKLPTGLANQGEDIWAAAVREVKEETGIDAEFQEVLCFRQAHGIAHGKSDLFVVCALRALTFDITPQESEIAAAKWLPLKSFREQPFFADRPLFRTMIDVCAEYAKGNYRGLQLHTSGDDLKYQMYIGEVDLNAPKNGLGTSQATTTR